MSAHLCGAGMAFLGFSLSLIIGLLVNNPFVTLMLRSLFVLLVFYLLGCLLFTLGQKAVQENFESEADSFNADAPTEPDIENSETERLQTVGSDPLT